MYLASELIRKGEVWVFNSKANKLPNRGGKLKTMRFGKQALDGDGNKIDPSYALPVFIQKSELDLLNKLWQEELDASRERDRLKYGW